MAEAGGDCPPDARAPEPLWREVLGSRLRALRTEHGETLAQTAQRAGLSPQYLSEIERGRKEPSSEMIAALAGALGTTLAELAGEVAADLRRAAGGFAVVRLGHFAQPDQDAARPDRAPAPSRATGPHALAA